ncbi:hypothetical protein B0H67DRAFT_640755 [Lasiosphaeris hirsuta]|uniref:Uncharacterized protein n=1 Tax=Lasiosphaeris hirsuta TaxID=260670 RepID=A0AA40E6F4_9PEZI|nr:hypothetical protein B0H67DRAFT_640755 [Lasiosphaeris hirsuta]
MTTEPLDLDPLKDEERSLFGDLEYAILISSEQALASTPSPSINPKACHFVASLLAQAIPANISIITSTQWSDKVTLDNFASDTWQVLSRIAPRPTTTRKTSPWNHDPTFEIDAGDDDREVSLDEWLNFNSFVARLFGAGVVRGFCNFAIWEMRMVLEEDDVVELGADP